MVRLLRGTLARSTDALVERWREVLAGSAPDARRPYRVAVGTPLRGTDLPQPAFEAVDLQWFTDAEQAADGERWLSDVDAELVIGTGGLDADSWRIAATEVVLRGTSYLDERWRVGGTRFKMLSYARRNPKLGLSLSEFLERWRDHAGSLGAETIPPPLRGQAYLQDHPVVGDAARPVDAINEVTFDRLEDLRARLRYFAARSPAGTSTPADDLFAAEGRGTIVVEERPVP